MSDLKKIIQTEYIKCAQDPMYFFKKYVYIQGDSGKTRFMLYPFQEKVLEKMLEDNHDDIILKSRQLGISTLVAALCLHRITFRSDWRAVVLATKQATAKNLLMKVQYAYDNLPSWLKLPAKEYNVLTLRLSNNSSVQAVSAASDAARSLTSNLLVIDEAAFVNDNIIESIWASAQQTLANTGGKSIIISTPNGTGNWYHRKWVRATADDPENEEVNTLAIRLPWTVHPKRDQKWRDEQDEKLGKKLAAQECDCDFLTSGDLVIDSDILAFYNETYITDPLEKRGHNRQYWLWAYPDYTRKYMVVADVARGDGADYSTFHVLDVEGMEQVAEFKAQVGTKEFAQLLYSVGYEWNNALLVVENASMGWSVVQDLIDLNYPNLYYSPKDTVDTAEKYLSRNYDVFNPLTMVPGFTNSNKTRPLLISKLISYLNDKSLIIHSKRFYEESRMFIWKDGKAQAQIGSNDDLIISMGIGCFIRDTALKFFDQGLALTRASLNSIKTSVTPSIFSNINSTPHQMREQANQQWGLDRGSDAGGDWRWLL